VDIIPAQGRDSFFACPRIGIEDTEWTKPGEPRPLNISSAATPASRLQNATRTAMTTSLDTQRRSIELVKQRWILTEDRPTLLLRSRQERAEATK